MNEFAQLFRKERVNARKTLREIGGYVNLSIGYLSDVERGRKNPPDIIIVKKIERFLGIEDGRLEAVAAQTRKQNINLLIKARPQLREVLLRADDLDDEQLERLKDYMKEMPNF